MKIADIRVHVCFAGWRNWVFVEVETECGLIGLGEATIEGREKTIEGHIVDLRRYFVGKDPREICEHNLRLTRDPFWVGGYVAMTGLAAIEIALWDILGKSLNAPVWSLLGGKVREKVRAYANGWYFGAKTVEEWGQRAGEVCENGFSALKFDPFGQATETISVDELERAVEIVSRLRETLGSRVDLLIEGHGRFSLHSASRVAAALQPFDCYWFEEPLRPGNEKVLADFCASCPIPVATGERIHSAVEYGRLLSKGAVSVVQPDIIHAGGILETRKIATMADAFSVPVAPHNPNGPVATAATLALDIGMPNFLIQEMLEPWDVSWRHKVVDGAPRVVDGFLTVSDRPGLGVELDLANLAEYPYQPIDPSFYTKDSVLETTDLRNS